MAKTLEKFLFEEYWSKAMYRRLPRQAKDMTWFITDNFKNVKRSWYTEERLYAVGLNGTDKKAVEIDCDGYAFYIAPMIPTSKMAEMAKKLGWEEIPEKYYDMEVRDL